MTNSPWKDLIDCGPLAPPEPSTGPGFRRHVAEGAVDIIRRGDVVSLKSLLAAGLRANTRYKGRGLLWEAVASEQWHMAHLLVAAGADPNERTASKKSLWSALAVRDNALSADRLVDLGCAPCMGNVHDFMSKEHAAPRLLEWWVAQGNEASIPQLTDSHRNHVINWLSVGVVATPALRETLNQSWGVDSQNPLGLVSAWGPSKSEWIEEMWVAIAKRDDVFSACACIQSGWAWPFVRSGNKALAGRPFVAEFVSNEAWSILAWLTRVPAFKQDLMAAMEAVGASGMPIGWEVASRNVSSLKKLTRVGLDPAHPNAASESLAHLIMGGSPSRAMMDWWLDNRPDLLEKENSQGQTPTRVARPETRAYLESGLLALGSCRASIASSPRYSRL